MRVSRLNHILLALLCLLFVSVSCQTEPVPLPKTKQPTLSATPYKTKNVILVVIDGVRFSETWGEPSKKHIPHMAHELAPQGTLFKNFRNQGLTYTVAGHTALLTGFYLAMDNFGYVSPSKPSFLQLWREASLQSKDKAWLVSGKAHLKALANCENDPWKDHALPDHDCGEEIQGQKIYVRNDENTFAQFLVTLKTHRPSLAVLALPDPDKIGHEFANTFAKKWSRWERYLTSIRENDKRVAMLWQYIQTDPYYKDKTALFVTHDHGRHSNGQLEPTFDHGDDCEGCRRIMLLALGPDFKRNHVVEHQAEQIDLAPTIGHLLGFKIPNSKGRVLSELLQDSP